MLFMLPRGYLHNQSTASQLPATGFATTQFAAGNSNAWHSHNASLQGYRVGFALPKQTLPVSSRTDTVSRLRSA